MKGPSKGFGNGYHTSFSSSGTNITARTSYQLSQPTSSENTSISLCPTARPLPGLAQQTSMPDAHQGPPPLRSLSWPLPPFHLSTHPPSHHTHSKCTMDGQIRIILCLRGFLICLGNCGETPGLGVPVTEADLSPSYFPFRLSPSRKHLSLLSRLILLSN